MGWIENIGGWEMVVIVLVGLFIFGPDRLPKAIGDGVRMLRQLRHMARNATGELSKELGTDIALEDLHPKTFLRKHVLSEEDEMAIRKPLESVYGTIRDEFRQVQDTANEIATSMNDTAAALTKKDGASAQSGGRSETSSGVTSGEKGADAPSAQIPVGPERFDVDAT